MAILTLALGIGANTALQCERCSDAEAASRQEPKTTRLLSSAVTARARECFLSRGICAVSRPRSHSFSGMSAFDTVRLTATVDGQGEFVSGQCVSGTFFSVLGVDVGVGRPLTAEDDQRGDPASP